MTIDNLPKPTWARLGFPYAPDVNLSGKGIGMVVLDRLRPHPTLSHLGSRLKYIVVNDDLTVTQRDIAFEEPDTRHKAYGEHGLMVVNAMAHAPFEVDGHEYIGLAPAANYIVLNHGAFREGEAARLKRGMGWILERRDEWNVKIVLTTGWAEADSLGSLESTDQKPVVQGLSHAVESGLLVIASNGNTKLENELPPIEYFAVGCYLDNAFSDIRTILPNPDEPWGRNRDGHMRPDILAPRLYLTIPFCEVDQGSESIFSLVGGQARYKNRLSYGAQSSGTSALLTGVCAHILSLYPKLGPEVLRRLLVANGDPVDGSDNPAPAVNVARALKSLAEGNVPPRPHPYPPPIRVTHPEISIQSHDPVERGLALTIMARQGKCDRDCLWRHAKDDSPTVRKVAVWFLQQPQDHHEREVYWQYLNAEPDGGVRGWLAYGLFHDSTKEEIGQWIHWAEDVNWAVRWCVSEYLKKCPGFPRLEKVFDPALVRERALPVLEWYRQKGSG